MVFFCIKDKWIMYIINIECPDLGKKKFFLGENEDWHREKNTLKRRLKDWMFFIKNLHILLDI